MSIKGELRKQRQAEHAARDAARQRARHWVIGDGGVAVCGSAVGGVAAKRASVSCPTCAAWLEERAARRRPRGPAVASREEQHGRYIDCGPGMWDDRTSESGDY